MLVHDKVHKIGLLHTYNHWWLHIFFTYDRFQPSVSITLFDGVTRDMALAISERWHTSDDILTELQLEGYEREESKWYR